MAISVTSLTVSSPHFPADGLTTSWTITGGPQTKFSLRLFGVDGGAGLHQVYDWNGSAWVSGFSDDPLAWLTSASTSVTAATVPAGRWYVTVNVDNGSSTASKSTSPSYLTVRDAPTATITAPAATVSTGGPTLTVSWTYAQAQAVAQGKYRVKVTNAAGTTTYWDTGLLAGATASVSINALTQGIPTDTTGSALRAVVYVETADGSTWNVTSTQAFDIQWGVPSVTVTAPTSGGTLSTTSLTATWSFSSTRSKTEGWYRVRLLSSTGSVLSDSGFVAGTATSKTVTDYVLAENAPYQVGVTVKNSEGVPTAESLVSFSTNVADPPSYPTEARVGSMFDIGINGVGYCLRLDPDRDLLVRWSAEPIEAQRYATAGSNFEERVDHYTFHGITDWRSGAGQLHYDRAASDSAAFYDSDGIDPFTAGGFRLLPQVATSISSAYAAALASVVSGVAYMVTSATGLSWKDASGTTGTVALTAAQTVTDLTSDGAYWYAAHGGAANGIARGTSSATLNWSAIVAESLWYAGQRVCAAVKKSPSTTPNVFTTLADDGTEEVAGGRLILPNGWTVVKGTGGSGQVWFGAYSGDKGLIYRWQAGTSSAPAVAMECLKGEIPTALFWYQGAVMLRTKKLNPSGGAKAVIYRCTVDANGNLTPFHVVTLGSDSTATDYGAGTFGADETRVFFSWPLMDGTNAGIGAYDITTGGYAKYLKAGAAGAVPSIVTWNARTGFVVAGTGLVYEQTSLVSSGYLTTSIVDKASALTKIFDELRVQVASLPSGASVQVDVSLDGGSNWTTMSTTRMATTGQTTKTTTLAKSGQSIMLKATLTPGSGVSPVVNLLDVRLHALGLADELLEIPVDCYDTVTGANGQQLPDNGPGRGAARVRSLLALAQQRIQLQWLDWPWTGTTSTYEVVRVEPMMLPAFRRQGDRIETGGVCKVTLRRLLK